jgi:hypothetical protein
VVPVPTLVSMSILFILIRAPIAILILIVVVVRVISSTVVESSIIEPAVISAILGQCRGSGVDSQQHGDEECETYLFDLFHRNSRFRVSEVEPKPGTVFYRRCKSQRQSNISIYRI